MFILFQYISGALLFFPNTYLTLLLFSAILMMYFTPTSFLLYEYIIQSQI